jgi:hypothetical protein
MSTWNDVAEIYALKIFIGNGSKSASIYSNGRHHVPIEIYIEARDSNGVGITLSSDEIYNNMNLVDYKNTIISDSVMVKTKEEGQYAYPIPSATVRSSGGSSCLCYIYAPEVSTSPLKISLQTFIGEKEYTTSEINNNGNALPDYISMDIRAPRIFSDDDLDIVTREEEDIDGYNCILKKYYVRFKSAENTITNDAECDEGFWFKYMQTGNYKGCCTSTDTSVEMSPDTYTKTFTFSDSWSITVTSKNHEERGICFWSYRVWKGAIWSYNEWHKSLRFFLHDQYGNRADIDVISDDNNQIEFSVLI